MNLELEIRLFAYMFSLMRKMGLGVFFLYLVLAFGSARVWPWGDKSIGGMGLMMLYSGWRDLAPEARQINPLNSHKDDDFNWQWPHWIYYKDQIKGGGFPVWNWSRAGGKEGILNFTNGTFSLSFLLYNVIPDPAKAVYWASILKLTLFAFGFYLLLSLFFLPSAAILGGVIAEFCGWNVSFLGNVSIDTAIWTPFIIWASLVFIKDRNPKYLMLFVLFATLMILGGMPSIAGFSFYAAGFYILYGAYTWCKSWKERAGVIGVLTFGLVTAILISAVPLLSFLHSVSDTNMLNRTGGTDFEFKNLQYFWNPNFKGANIYPTHNVYLGKIGLFLVLAGIVLLFMKRWRKAPAFKFVAATAGLVLVFISIATGALPRFVIDHLPLIGKNPWHYLNGHIIYFMIPIATFALYALFEFINKSKFPQKKIIFAVLWGAILLAQYYDTGRMVTKVNNIYKASWWYIENPTMTYVAKNSIKPFDSAIADIWYNAGGAVNGYGINEWTAHDIHPQESKDLLGRIIENPFVSVTATRFEFPQVRFQEQHLMSAMGIRYAIVGGTNDVSKVPATWDKKQLEPRAWVLENLNAPKGPYYVPELDEKTSLETDSIDWSQTSNTQININYDGNKSGWIVLPMKIFPGWVAKSDTGEMKVDRFLNILPAIRVDGPVKLSYTYTLPYLQKGLILMVLGVILLIFLPRINRFAARGKRR